MADTNFNETGEGRRRGTEVTPLHRPALGDVIIYKVTANKDFHFQPPLPIDFGNFGNYDLRDAIWQPPSER